MKKEIEIIALIYKSANYLKFIFEQLTGPFNKVEGWDVRVRIVANDATDEVIVALSEMPEMNVSIYSDARLDDYYLNRVYRCWNYSVRTSSCEYVCLVNSDMAFSENWLSALIKDIDLDKMIPCSRLVESGKLLSGQHAIVKNFGRHIGEFKQKEWNEFANKTKTESIFSGGLYMPCIFNTKRFMHSGGYPEGNIYEDGIGTCNGRVVKSGDAYFFQDILGLTLGMSQVTVFDSLVYHFQEGEMDAR